MPDTLSADELCWRCTLTALDFATTAELERLDGVLGHARATEAIAFGLEMDRDGYNIFALGPEDMDKDQVVRRFLEDSASSRPTPRDWCYLTNFGAPQNPRALSLPAGKGAVFRDDMAQFVADIRDALRAAFETEDYRTQRQVLEEEFKETQEKAIADVEAEAQKHSMTVLRTPLGFAVAPVHEGRPLAKEVFDKLPAEEQERIKRDIEELEDHLKNALQQIPARAKELRDKIRKLNDDTARYAIAYLIKTIRKRYTEFPEIQTHLDALQQDVIRNVEAIIDSQQTQRPNVAVDSLEDGHPLFRRYLVNLIVDHHDTEHAPVVYEDEPNFDRLFGRVEHRAEMGALLTDFHLIRPGALHRANGGYLMIDARKLLTRPMAWDGLKRALFAREIRIESLAKALGLLSTITLEPEPIPLDLKVVILGERLLYYLLAHADPDFGRLFKVAADFDESIERDTQTEKFYARLVATLAADHDLKPFERDAVARVLEFAARQAGDVERLTTHLESVSDLMREADFWARKNKRSSVGEADVLQAAGSRLRRLDRIRERTYEAIEHGTVAIGTDGAVAGQVNGLSVLQLGAFAFARPSRITARIGMGKGEVIDIEREVELGGPIHSKGVLILSGFIRSAYLADMPPALSASLVFEQSYGGVEGDSASLAEACALLSAIAEIPVKQSLAVTGSINQRGEIQAIGGVNEKIEGFFDVCALRGLTGDQGVLIPAANVRHLMLHDRVIDAARQGRFKVFAVRTFDEAIEILTGVEAGRRRDDGSFHPDSFNGRVESRLKDLHEKRRALEGKPGEKASP